MKVCENAYVKRLEIYPNSPMPVYIIGSEVPIPGGAQEVEEGLEVTKVNDFKHTVEVYYDLMKKEGLPVVTAARAHRILICRQDTHPWRHLVPPQIGYRIPEPNPDCPRCAGCQP